MDTFPSLFSQQANSRKSDIAIRKKRHGLWQSWTWEEAGEIVRDTACGLAAKGVKPNEKVAIIGNNIPNLYFGMVAIQCLGAVAVPIHPDSKPEELVAHMNDCEAKFALVQDQQQVDACYEIKEQCENFEQMVYSNGRGMQEYTSSRLHSFEQIREAGKKFASDHPNFYKDVTANVTPDSDAFILYTSGTSGKSRGAVHTHKSLIETGKVFAEQEHIKQDEQVLAFLPLSYAANILFTYTLWLIKGFTICCPESNETIMTDLREIGPSILYAPPHFYKRLHSEIIARAQRSKSKLFDKWNNFAKQAREKFINGGAFSGGDSFKYKMGNMLMFGPLKNVYGLSNLRKAYTGGDIMSGEVFNFFRGIGLNLKKTYGTTESAGFICVQGPDQLNSPTGEYSMGKPSPGIEIKKLADDQIAFKGINAFKGYYRDPEATAAVVDADGWIKTGDMGEIDEKGALKITDRVDSVGKFSTGDLFAPHLVESALKSSPYIQEAVAVGDGKDTIAAFVVIDSDTVGSWAEANRVRFTGYRDLATKDEVYELVQKTVADVNAHMEQIEGKGSPPIKRFLIMHREFNVDAGEMTRSRKIRRDVVMGRHKAMVDALYSSQSIFEVKDTSSGETLAELKLQSA